MQAVSGTDHRPIRERSKHFGSPKLAQLEHADSGLFPSVSKLAPFPEMHHYIWGSSLSFDITFFYVVVPLLTMRCGSTVDDGPSPQKPKARLLGGALEPSYMRGMAR